MDIIDGFAFLFANPTALGFVALAAFSGIVFGALPGLTAAAAIAMLVPITYWLDPLSALAFLYVIGKSGRFGGSIAAILFNTPGTTASAATMLDGYPMTVRGESGKALKMATLASVVGDTIGELILIFGAATIAIWTAGFGPPEYFAIHMMAFVVIGSVVGSSIIKGLVATLIGILVALVGLDPITASARFTFGVLELESGFSLVPLLVGMFVISEIMFQLESIWRNRKAPKSEMATIGSSHLSWAEIRPSIPVMLRSSGYGSLIGMMPGLGSSVAAFVAYGEEKRRARDGKAWGTGVLAGIAAPESANNAVSGPSMIPLLTLGVPGATVAAILMGVFLIHGIQIGPQIFTTSRELIFGLFAAGLVGIVCYGIIGWYLGPLIGRVIHAIPAAMIYPFILVTALTAAYATRLSLFDVEIMLMAGIAGWIMRKLGFPVAAFIIAFILTPGAEEALRQTLLLSNDGAAILLYRPVALGFLLVGLAVIIIRGLGAYGLQPARLFRRSPDRTSS